MNDPKRHHYVQEAYIKGFSEEDTEYVHLFSKTMKSCRRQRPKEIFVRNKYYRQDWAPDGVDKNIFEKTLGAEQEPNGLNAIKKLIDCPESLEQREMADILVYLTLQRIRVPRQAETAKALLKETLEDIILEHPEGENILQTVEVSVKDSFRFDYMRMSHDLFIPYFTRMVWTIVTPVQKETFLTSDNPVTFFNECVFPPSEPGIGLYGTRVLFPVDKRHLLIMTHPEHANGLKEPCDSLPNDIKFEDRDIEIRRGYEWSDELVSNHNHVMYVLSHDSIVADNSRVLENAVRSKVCH